MASMRTDDGVLEFGEFAHSCIFTRYLRAFAEANPEFTAWMRTWGASENYMFLKFMEEEVEREASSDPLPQRDRTT